MASKGRSMPVMGLWINILPALLLFTFPFKVNSIHNDKFTEELYVKPYPTGHVMFHFQFATVWNVSISSDSSFTHYRLFPKSIGDVLSTYHIQELHLSQTQGLWRYQKWGYSPEPAPPGVELWVWFQPYTKQIDKLWAELVNTLSGLFCSSLNFMDSKATVSPRWTFRPQGLDPEGYSFNSQYLRYAALPREIVCTENLTPWKKLLPCDSKVGLSTLFTATKLHDSTYHSIGLHVRPVCRDPSCRSSAVELKQTLTAVFDPTIQKSNLPDWSLRAQFGQPLFSQCPLASISRVYVDITDKEAGLSEFSLLPEPNEVRQVNKEGENRTYAIYKTGQQLEVGRVLDIRAKYNQKITYTKATPPPVYAHRFVTGFGLEKGGITCQIYNNLSENLTVIYMETIPWYLRVYYQSLKIENGGNLITPYKLHYIPGKDRTKSYQLEVVFRLRSNSVTKISMSFERVFLRWTEYPPDANHGFYVNSAILSTVIPVSHQYTALPQNVTSFHQSLQDRSQSFFLRVHTETLLVSLPTPDFSMPYNVICLACTVVAIAFGSIHNLTTRVFKAVDPKKSKGLKQKIKDFFSRRNNTREPPKDTTVRDSEVKSDSN